MHRLKRWTIPAAVVLVLVLVGWFVVTPRIVVGHSMTPTLKPWDLCFMERVYHYHPRRGDIVIFRTADNPPLYFIKRVIALPGETIAITNGTVTINGRPLAEPYTKTNPAWHLAPLHLPAGKIYVIGDNRKLAMADYVHGVVATRLVQGRLLWHWRWKRSH